MQQQLNRKKLLVQLMRIRGGGLRVRTWRGGAVRISGLSSMEVPVKRFPCPICPSTTFSRQASLLIHFALRHPPRNTGHQARLKCPVCGKHSRTLRAALRHRGHHLSQGSFSCPKCRSRFWNGTLLARHRVSCRGVTGGGSGNWGLKVKSPPQEAVQKKEDDGQKERTTVVTEYSH